MTASTLDPVRTEPAPAGDRPPSPGRGRWSAFWRHPAARWSAALLLVIVIIATTITAFATVTTGLGPDDPRSSLRDGASAAGAVLQQEGVRILPTRQVDEAVREGEGGTIVVAAPDDLSPDQARRILAVPDARVILLLPRRSLERFGVAARYQVGTWQAVTPPDCTDPVAQRAGTSSFTDGARYQPTGTPAMACYPNDAGYGYLRVGAADGREIELLAGGWTNEEIAEEGNAALVLGLFGSRERLVWLLSPVPDRSPAGSSPDGPRTLPDWWPMAAAQLFVGLVVVGIWRGRRLGPIIQERLPVRVRASETVEGHGRLYFRLSARDRAAAALREGAVRRLSARYGHGSDPMALSAAVADRTGRDSRQVFHVLFGPVPEDDDQLQDLAENLDDLEQEARQP